MRRWAFRALGVCLFGDPWPWSGTRLPGKLEGRFRCTGRRGFCHGRGHDAVTHREDPGAEAVGKVEVVRGDQDGGTGVRGGPQRRRDCCACCRVEAAGGLIDQEYLGVVHGLQRDGKDPALSCREVPGMLVSNGNPDVSPQTGKA